MGGVNQVGKWLSNCSTLFAIADQRNWRMLQTNTKSRCTRSHASEGTAKWKEEREALRLP